MIHHGFVAEQSRKSKAVRSLYESLRQRTRPDELLPAVEWETVQANEGVRVCARDKQRAIGLRLQDEHYSPYFKTDMNLFHLLMMDESVDMVVYKADVGWLLVFDGLPSGPQPFGHQGYDPR